MSLKTQRQGQLGVNRVESIVLEKWSSRWQPIEGHNDDGVDGLIFIEENGEATGQIVFVQVKCYSGVRTDKKGRFALAIGTKKLARNLETWHRIVGAAILVYVDAKSDTCCWVNLMDSAYVGSSQVFVPVSQTFDVGAKAIISKLCGTIHRDLHARAIETCAEDYSHLQSNKHIQVSSRGLYRQLCTTPVRLGCGGPVIEFDRNGWRHITRPERSKLTKYQSFVLLGSVRKILNATALADLVRHESVAEPKTNFFSTKASVSFPFRQTGIVKVIIRETIRQGLQVYKFHTVYEPRRKRTLIGVRQPLSQ